MLAWRWQIVNIAGPSDWLLRYSQQLGKPIPIAIKTFTHVFRETDFPLDVFFQGELIE